MSRPEITLEVLKSTGDEFKKVFSAVAKLNDFKSVFDAQVKDAHTLSRAIEQVISKDASLLQAMHAYANNDLNYGSIVYTLINNKLHFRNLNIPTRNPDFVVSDSTGGGGYESQDTYFYIKERLEINVLNKLNAMGTSRKEWIIAKLMVDEESDSLLFNTGDGGGWIEYGMKATPSHNVHFSDKVAQKYKEYLAEQQLLKD